MRGHLFLVLCLNFVLLPSFLPGQTLKVSETQQQLSLPEIEQIVTALEVKQKEIEKNLPDYTYTREILIQTIGQDGSSIESEYHRISEMTYDDKGTPIEKILLFPKPRIRYHEYNINDKTLKELAQLQAVPVEAEKLRQHKFLYLGKENVLGREAYAFRLSPLVEPKDPKNPYFSGEIWVDCNDLQVIKAYGKGEPDTKKGKFPTETLTCVKVDDKYWFPAEQFTDQILEFKHPILGRLMGYKDGIIRLHTRQSLKFSEYKRFKTEMKILD